MSNKTEVQNIFVVQYVYVANGESKLEKRKTGLNEPTTTKIITKEVEKKRYNSLFYCFG